MPHSLGPAGRAAVLAEADTRRRRAVASRAAKWFCGLTLVVSALLPSQLTDPRQFDISAVLATATISVGAIVVIAGARRIPRPAIWLVALPLLAPLIALFVSGGRFSDLIFAERPFVFTAVLVLALLAHKNVGRRGEVPFARAIRLLGALEGLLALAQRAGLELQPWYGAAVRTLGSGDDRAYGTLGHPIMLGLFCGFALLCSLSAPRHIDVIAVPLQLVGLVLSGSRGPWTATVVGLLFLAWSRREVLLRHVGQVVLFVTLGAAAMTLISITASATVGAYLGEASSRLDGIGTDQSSLARALRLNEGWSIFTASVRSVALGNGPAFATHYLLNHAFSDNQAAVFDQSYLSWAIDYGSVGLMLIILPLAIVLLRPGAMQAGAVLLLIALAGFDQSTWAVSYVMQAILVASALTVGSAVTNLDNGWGESGSAQQPASTVSRHVRWR